MARRNANWTWREMRDIVFSQWKSRLLQLFSRKWNFMSLWKPKDKAKLWRSVVVFDRIIKARMYDLRLTAIYSNIDKNIYIYHFYLMIEILDCNSQQLLQLFISLSAIIYISDCNYLYLCHEINTMLSTKILHFFSCLYTNTFCIWIRLSMHMQCLFLPKRQGSTTFYFFFLNSNKFREGIAESFRH